MTTDTSANTDYAKGSPNDVDSSLDDLVSRIDSLVLAYGADAQGPQLKPSGEQKTPVTAPPPVADGRARVAPPTRPSEATTTDPRNVLSAVAATAANELSDLVQSAKIMIVADEPTNAMAVTAQLKQVGYESVISTTKADQALDLMRRERPDIVLLDIDRLGRTGLEILHWQRSDPTLASIPVLVLTASADPDFKREAYALGANDFLAKPLDLNEMAPRVRNILIIKKQYERMADEAARLEQLVRRRTAELEHSRRQLILSLARAAEHRDNETGYHVIRVGRYAGVIARALGWNESRVEMLEQAAQLHDVGKIGVPDAILFKPGKLDPQEFDTIKKHCGWGKGIIEPFSDQEFQTLKSHVRFGEAILHIRTSPMLMMASRIAQTHHENWDGTGYPLGLVGEEIPIEGRVTAIAEVFDALSSERPYKSAFPSDRCFEIMREQRGRKFDPQLLDAFFSQSASILRIQSDFADQPSTT